MVDIGEHLQLRIDICSAQGLLKGEQAEGRLIGNKLSDPYVVIMLGKEEIHRTGYISKNLNPVWTPKQDNAFILDCTVAKVADHNGLDIFIRNYEAISKDENIGYANLGIDALTGKNGGNLTIPIAPPPGLDASDISDAGTLTIHIQKATHEDKETLKKHHKKILHVPGTGTIENAVKSTVFHTREAVAEAKHLLHPKGGNE